jgi:hypothetical protein
MKKLLSILGGFLLTFVFVTSVSAAGAGKASLYNSPNYTPGVTCPNGADDTSGPTFGFVVMNINHNGDLIVEVSLKGATPSNSYDIWVNQDPGTCPLSEPTKVGALTTNRNGNGNTHLKITAQVGAANYWVSAVGGGQVLRSTALNLLERTFTASDSQYYSGSTDSTPIYGNGPINFTWDPTTGNVTGGYWDEIYPAYTGTTYHNPITSGSVIGNTVNLVFDRTTPVPYHFTFTGTLIGNVLTGQMAGPYYFTATAN